MCLGAFLSMLLAYEREAGAGIGTPPTPLGLTRHVIGRCVCGGSLLPPMGPQHRYCYNRRRTACLRACLTSDCIRSSLAASSSAKAMSHMEHEGVISAIPAPGPGTCQEVNNRSDVCTWMLKQDS
jgi:hypothetical protein